MNELEKFIDHCFDNHTQKLVKTKYVLTDDFYFYLEKTFYQQHVSHQPRLSDFEWNLLDILNSVVEKCNFNDYLKDLASKVNVSLEYIKYMAFRITTQKLVSMYII